MTDKSLQGVDRYSHRGYIHHIDDKVKLTRNRGLKGVT
jgi:hypothetical protein